MALQAVYNIVDSAFVGNMRVGSEAALNLSLIHICKHGGRYMTFLMKEEVAENYPNDLQKHIEYLQQYHKTGYVIRLFLLCAQEDGKVYDFYKTFAEIC